MIQNISEAEAYFSQFIGAVSRTTGKDVTVERMWPLLRKANNPQDKLKVIHIAGTSGKTSTAYFMAALLKASGQKVGLTVSPHISSITERLQINGRPITNKEFCSQLSRFIKIIGDDIDASYFEILIVFVLWVFVELKVNYAVVETGMGGLHDATNIFKQADKICIITDIGLDHQHVLGHSVQLIAAQKAGIIQTGNHVFMYKQARKVTTVFSKKCREVSAKLHLREFTHGYGSNLPLFQQRNWQLAKKVYDYIQDRDSLELLTLHALSQSEVNVPGRMQKVVTGKQVFILDGAHNVQKMTAFVSSFQAMYPNMKVPMLLAIKKDKDYEKVVEIISPIVSRVYCVGFSTTQDMPIESVDPDLVVDSCRRIGITQAEKCSDIADALEKMKTNGAPINIVTGSFYILGDAIKLL